jgi:GAF domain-containing protein
MISKTAISYDLHEALEQISCGYTADAGRQIGRLVERLDFMLTPYGPGNKRPPSSSPCSADEFGRENVQTVRLLCQRASQAIDLHQSEEAQSLLRQADDLLEAVTVKGAD